MTYPGPSAIFEIISDAGGRIVGRTRLQKCVCALELAGLGFGFQFSYKHFGPYSEELQLACNDADALRLIDEELRTATWGGHYSVFVARESQSRRHGDEHQHARSDLLNLMTAADPVALELAVTAAFLANNGVSDPWAEVAERKYDKVGAMDAAKALYGQMRAIRVPKPLPGIV